MKLFKKVFVCVVAVCTMTTITNASNMDFISKDSVAYTVNGIDAYPELYQPNGAKLFSGQGVDSCTVCGDSGVAPRKS